MPFIALMVFGIVFAIGSTMTTVDKDTFKRYDFKTYNLDCNYGAINVVLEDNKFVLIGTYNCVYAEFGERDTIDMLKQPLRLKYSDADFFTCMREGIKDTICFTTYVKPKWDEETLNYQYVLRRYLAQMQNSSNTILSRQLIKYYQT